MIGYVIALIVLAVFALYLFVDGVWTHTELDIAKTDIDELYKGFNDYRARCDAHKELIEALSKSVRELNGVVEAAVKAKEETSDNKPDTKALIGGWTTDDVRTGNDASCIGIGLIDGQTLVIPVRDTGRVLMNHGKAVANHWHGRLWTDDEGRIYELPEGCFISGDKSYEMDQ